MSTLQRKLTVDELIELRAKIGANEVIDVGHLTPMELIKFRLADKDLTIATRSDNGKLFIACEAGAMKGAILAGFAEAIDEHDLQRVIDGGVGSSVGTVAACGIATRTPSAGADAQRYLGDKEVYANNPGLRYINLKRI